MDEILASIRNIIADDVKNSTKGKQIMDHPMPKDNDVLELTEMLQEDGSVVSLQREGRKKSSGGSQNKSEEDDVDLNDSHLESLASPSKSKGQEKMSPEDGEDDFISHEALSASMQALQGLDSISQDALQEVGRSFDSGKTLESLMIDILRPMLKEWMDANLPSLVKVIVNDQVEKVMQARRLKTLGSLDSQE